MKLFTIGPCEMYEDTLKVKSEQVPYFRNEEFSKIVKNCERKIKKMINSNENDKVVFLTCSGTGALECMYINCFDENDKILIINGGTFGQRLVDLAQIFNIKYHEIKLKSNEELKKEHFENIDLNKFTALVMQHHETSTGQLYNLKMVSDYCKKNNMRLMVDAISSFLADEINMKELNIDCVVVSSQKALSLSPGLSIMVIKDKYYNNHIKNKKIKSLYYNIPDYVKNIERGQTPFTPAVGIILELNERLNHIINYDEEILKTQKKADTFRKELMKYNIKYSNLTLSNAITPVIAEGKAQNVIKELKEKYGYYVNPCGGENSNNIFRVSHVGNIMDKDLIDLAKRISEVVK